MKDNNNKGDKEIYKNLMKCNIKVKYIVYN